ncbi:MAG: tRNA pseudouridine(38-40) synthase TruA [Kiloniellales bacterium]|nr:tRNA pseudouridine(38-40) synthase TruA [Kiloniellales bacterium]
MARWKLTIEYDGTDYVGWQRQDNGPSIQGTLERAVAGFCGETVNVIGAGRTDSGVHAFGQVAHLDLERETTPKTLRDALNHHLKPHPIAVLSAEPAAPGFHARFSAVSRGYLYRIVNRRAPLALDRNRAWFVPVPLDAEAMHAAAQVLVGHHDFSSFRAADCQADSPVKTLDLLNVVRVGRDVRIEAKARSFLHRQVRNMVGSLKLVGAGKWREADLRDALEARDRRAAGPAAPACGLYLTAVGYDEPETAGC